MLFKPDSDVVSDGAPEFDANEALEEAYETVNEGETTDTTSGLDTEGLLDARKQSASSSTGQTDDASKAWKDAAKDARLQEGGIKSSSDSEAEEAGASSASAADGKEAASAVQEAANAQGGGGAQQEGSAAAENVDAAKQEELRRLSEAARITSFKEEAGGAATRADDDDLFGDERNREQVEHNYGFSGQKIEEYSAILENKLDSLESIDEQVK